MSHLARKLVAPLLREAPVKLVGRWCMPASHASCNQEIKADLNTWDHSCDPSPEGRVFRVVHPSADDAETCPWSNPTLVTLAYGYGV